MRWYCRARRITPASATGWPSSLNPAAPASASSTCSVSSAPRWPTVIAARNPTRTAASCSPRSSSDSSTEAVSTTGAVFGMATIVAKPPRGGGQLPVAMSSRSSRPGVRRCTWGSTKPGTATRPAASTSSSPSPTRRCARRGRPGPAPRRWPAAGLQDADAPQHERRGRAGPLHPSRTPIRRRPPRSARAGSTAPAGSASRS